MGTSSSSAGPGKGVPLDPPWLDQIENPEGLVPSATTQEQEIRPDVSHQQDIPNSPEGSSPRELNVELAPERRFVSARRSLGNFVKTGNQDNFRNSVGHYSKTGMGGARKLARRMRLSTSTAVGLVNLLQDVRKGAVSQHNKWLESLAAKKPTAQEVMEEIVKQVASSGGSIDENSCHDSMTRAIVELIEDNPKIDLLKLNDDDIWTVVKIFLGNEACNRLRIDIGQIFESSKIKPRDSVLRANEMQKYLIEEISAQIESLRKRTSNPNPRVLELLLQEALKNTFEVYEGTV